MTTRFNAKDEKNHGVLGISSGYDGNLKSDLSIPSCGIEDVDVSLFVLFDKEIQPTIGGIDSAELKKVPIIFAAGEKWAMLKKRRPLRDKSNTLILPLVTIMRTSIAQAPDDFTKRGINQQTGELVVHRRLDKSDRNYQNLINKSLILNQTNVAISVTGSNVPIDNQITTSRLVGKSTKKSTNNFDALLVSNKKNNIFETIVVPAPQFYVATYEVTIWAQYMQHMNQIIEKFVSSFLPQAQAWKLITPKGYWFIATIEGGNFNIETNFDDMSSSERFIKCSFTLKVPAYILASTAPGIPVSVKRYISSPMIEFSVAAKGVSTATSPEEYSNGHLLGSDDPTLPLDDRYSPRDDQRSLGGRQQTNSPDKIDSNDPALINLPRGVNPSTYQKIIIGNEVKYAKIININSATGETIYSTSDIEGLKIILTS